MKNLERLMRLEERVFRKPKASLRDYWRMVRHLPEFSREVVGALAAIDARMRNHLPDGDKPMGKREADARSQPVETHGALPAARLADLARSGRLLLVVPPGKEKMVTLDLVQFADLTVSFGSEATILTNRDDYAAVVYFEEISAAFRETNRFFLDSGRITEILVTRGVMSDVRLSSRR